MTDNIIDVEVEAQEKRQGRRGDGGVYLVVADETPEFLVALRYAALMARSNRGHIAILQIMNIDDFQHWGSVEERMRKEMRDQAEKFIWNSAKAVNELNGILPALYIAEGNRTDVLIETINKDDTIRLLVLGGGVQAGGPGALVAHFTGKGLGKLRVPVVVVPGHLEPEAIDALA
ncbi:MAG: universal stress protein [Alphaproteobacteria bacterium]|nr:universal stress protein [Alphaproteobacteria bacterium]